MNKRKTKKLRLAATKGKANRFLNSEVIVKKDLEYENFTIHVKHNSK
jgi:hypothetical protein